MMPNARMLFVASTSGSGNTPRATPTTTSTAITASDADPGVADGTPLA